MTSSTTQERISLPIDARLAEIQSTLNKTNTLILQASPGTGKTTRVPPTLLSSVQGKILVLQPRRIAARMAAQRIADELGENCGQTVGYRVRFEKNTTEKTRIEFLTEGLFLRQMQENPKLPGVGCLILDEFHERHIHTDTALALARKLQRDERPDLKLIIMSATLPSEELKSYLPGSEIVRVEAKMHPVRIDYMPGQSVYDAVIDLVHDHESTGHILVFLPGARDISFAAEKLAKKSGELDLKIFQLHGSLNLQEQRQVFLPSGQRKVVLATNIAESSITIDGITGVVDTGVAKISGFANWSGLQTLSLRPVSQAACIQRAGRAGRTRSGVVKRLYDKLDFSRRPAFEKPELQRTDLTPLVLELKGMAERFGDGFSVENLPWLEAPEKERVDVSIKLLKLLGALDQSGSITSLGREMAALPMHPRLSRIILEGKTIGCVGAAVLAAAALSENYIQPDAQNREKVDFCEALGKLAKRSEPRFQRIVEQFARESQVSPNEPRKPIDETKLTTALFKGFCDRIEKSGVKNKNREDEYILALDAQEDPYSKGKGVIIKVAAPISTEMLLDGPTELLKDKSEVIWDEARKKVRKVTRLYYQDHLLEEQDQDASEEEIQPILQKALRENWPKPFDDAADLAQLRARIKFLQTQKISADFPDFGEGLPQALIKTICQGKSSFAEIGETDFSQYLDAMMGEPARKALRNMAPNHLQLTPKRSVKIHYEEGKPPWIESRIQDFFGLTQSPAICGGRIPLTVHLLAPNGRAEQVTSDLAGFWQNIYPKLRSSLGRRYPRHPWPENPTIKLPPKS